MAQVFFLNLTKRNCNVKIELTPLGTDFLEVKWHIGGDDHYFQPSGVMGSQFSSFLQAVYLLYEEPEYPHQFFHRWHRKDFEHEVSHNRPDRKHLLTSRLHWDEEGFVHEISFLRMGDTAGPSSPGVSDPIRVKIRSGNSISEYDVDGRDLCYATAKACTDAWKTYGFFGYEKSTSGQYSGDGFSLNELLFVKAYALDALSVREMELKYREPDGWEKAEASNFRDEIQLILFDM